MIIIVNNKASIRFRQQSNEYRANFVAPQGKYHYSFDVDEKAQTDCEIQRIQRMHCSAWMRKNSENSCAD